MLQIWNITNMKDRRHLGILHIPKWREHCKIIGIQRKLLYYTMHVLKIIATYFSQWPLPALQQQKNLQTTNKVNYCFSHRGFICSKIVPEPKKVSWIFVTSQPKLKQLGVARWGKHLFGTIQCPVTLRRTVSQTQKCIQLIKNYRMHEPKKFVF